MRFFALIVFLALGSEAFPASFQARPQDPCLRAESALAYRELKLAEEMLLECVAERPDEKEPYARLCGLYQTMGNEEALFETALRAWERFPEDSKFCLTAGVLAGRLGRLDDAVRVLSKGVERWPQDPNFQDALVDAYLERALQEMEDDRYREAIPDLKKVLEFNGENTEALLNLGRALHNVDESLEALALFDRVLQIDDSTPLVHFHRGMVLYSLGDYDEALIALDSEIERNSEYPPAFLFRGLTYVVKGKWEKALVDLDQAIKRMPENSEAHFARGRCLERLERREAAESAFRQSIRLDPADPRPYSSLGRLLLLKGRQEEGRSLLQKARRLHEEKRSVRPGEVRYQSTFNR